MRSVLDGERKVAGPDDAWGRPPIVKGLFVGRQVCGRGGGRQWPLDSRSLRWVFGRAALEGVPSVGCLGGGRASRSGRDYLVAASRCLAAVVVKSC
jgi:hypothetical protein